MEWHLSQHLGVVTIKNGAFWSPSTKVANYIFTYFYIPSDSFNLFPNTHTHTHTHTHTYIYIYIQKMYFFINHICHVLFYLFFESSK